MGPDWMVRGHSFAQETRCSGVGKRLISSPISAMIICALCSPMPGSRRVARALGAQWGTVAGRPGSHCRRRCQDRRRRCQDRHRARTRARAGVAGIDGPSRVGHRRQQLLDAGGQRVDLGGERVDLGQQHPGQLGVMVIEAAVNASMRAARLVFIRPRARPASSASRSPAINASIMARPDTAQRRWPPSTT